MLRESSGGSIFLPEESSRLLATHVVPVVEVVVETESSHLSLVQVLGRAQGVVVIRLQLLSKRQELLQGKIFSTAVTLYFQVFHFSSDFVADEIREGSQSKSLRLLGQFSLAVMRSLRP